MNDIKLIFTVIAIILISETSILKAQNINYKVWKSGKEVGYINCPQNDNIELESGKAVATLSGIEQITFSQTSGTALGKEIRQFISSNILENPYGICGAGTNEVRDICMTRMSEAAVGYLRTNMWVTEPISTYSSITTAAKNRNIEILPILTGGLDKANLQSSINQWSTYAQSAMTAYPHIRVWEVMNEPNNGTTFTPVLYSQLLRGVYQAIKQKNPETQVTLGGIMEISISYMEDLFKEGAQNYFDIVNIHSYNTGNTPEQLIVQYRALQALMDKYSFNKPVWLTETGRTTVYTGWQLEEMTGHGFFTEVIPQICTQQLNINPENTCIGLLSEPSLLYHAAGNLDANLCFSNFASHKYIRLKELQTLNPEEIPILIVSVTETFPMQYFDALENYIRKGGTAVFSVLSPFRYNFDSLTNATSVSDYDNYCSRLHIKIGGVSGIPSTLTWQRPATGFNFQYRWDYSSGSSERYLTDGNLQNGDKFIPVLQTGDNTFSGTVIGLYKLNSNGMKGNIIVQTRNMLINPATSEANQAERMVRAYLVSHACGVEKTFLYALWTPETGDPIPENIEDYYGIIHANGNPKLAFLAYQILTTMCPNNSTRPVMTEKDGAYIATWTKPDGTKMSAVWTPMIPAKINLKITGNPVFYNIYGDTTQKDVNNFIAGSEVTYIVNGTAEFQN
jgi:hypothetical protein